MENEIEPTLYIVMRTDIPDNTPGKMMAQASHATDDFNAWKNSILHEFEHDFMFELVAEFNRWKEDRNFGRCIVLEGTLEEIHDVVDSNDFAGLTTDPTYPWRNFYGEVFLTEEVTAAWCFICNETSPCETLRGLPLHR